MNLGDLVTRTRLEAGVRQRSIERAWQERANRRELVRRLNLPGGVMAAGRISPRTSLPSALLGLRLGTAHLVVRARSGGDMELRHQWIPRQQLEWSTLDHRIPDGGPFNLEGTVDGIPVLVEQVSESYHGAMFSEGWWRFPRRGWCRRIRLGLGPPQETWHAWLLGLDTGERSIAIDGVAIDGVETALSDRRGSEDVPDLPRVVEATLRFPNAVSADEAESFVDSTLWWLLELYAGAEVVPAGLWSEDCVTGKLTDYWRELLRPPRRIIPRRVRLDQYLAEVVPSWNGLTPEQRLTLKFAIGGRRATRDASVVISIAVAAFTLELFCTEWLSAEQIDFEMPSDAAKDEIKKAIRLAVSEHAAGSELERNLDIVFGYLFSRPARGRFERLFDQFGIPYEAEDLTHFTRRRNRITHPVTSAAEHDANVRAMLFGYHMVGRCVLKRLGYSDLVKDEARQRELPN